MKASENTTSSAPFFAASAMRAQALSMVFALSKNTGAVWQIATLTSLRPISTLLAGCMTPPVGARRLTASGASALRRWRAASRTSVPGSPPGARRVGSGRQHSPVRAAFCRCVFTAGAARSAVGPERAHRAQRALYRDQRASARRARPAARGFPRQSHTGAGRRCPAAARAPFSAARSSSPRRRLPAASPEPAHCRSIASLCSAGRVSIAKSVWAMHAFPRLTLPYCWAFRSAPCSSCSPPKVVRSCNGSGLGASSAVVSSLRTLRYRRVE